MTRKEMIEARAREVYPIDDVYYNALRQAYVEGATWAMMRRISNWGHTPGQYYHYDKRTRNNTTPRNTV